MITIEKKYYTIPYYNCYLCIVISNSADLVRQVFPAFEGDSVHAHACVGEYKGCQAIGIVLNFDPVNGHITHGTITHEVLHTVNFIARDHGFIADFNNDEPLAYLAGWVADKVYLTLSKFKLKPMIIK